MKRVLLAKEGAEGLGGRANVDSVVKRAPLRLLNVKGGIISGNFHFGKINKGNQMIVPVLRKKRKLTSSSMYLRGPGAAGGICRELGVRRSRPDFEIFTPPQFRAIQSLKWNFSVPSNGCTILYSYSMYHMYHCLVSVKLSSDNFCEFGQFWSISMTLVWQKTWVPFLVGELGIGWVRNTYKSPASTAPVECNWPLELFPTASPFLTRWSL